MKPFMILALLGSLSPASAQNYAPSPEAIKSVDAQAVAFTGKHCTSKFTAKPPRPLSAAGFQMAANFSEQLFKAEAKKNPALKVRSKMVNKDLFLLTANSAESGRKLSAFVVMYRDQGQVYVYGCELK